MRGVQSSAESINHPAADVWALPHTVLQVTIIVFCFEHGQNSLIVFKDVYLEAVNNANVVGRIFTKHYWELSDEFFMK